jgi:hypothetical protein
MTHTKLFDVQWSRLEPTEPSDNGRLSGTTAGERLDGDGHGAQRPYLDPHARTSGAGSDGFMNMPSG